MKRWGFFVFGVGSYLLFLVTYAYMACFLGGFAGPKTIDAPASHGGAWAVAFNLVLVLAFAMQHSIMARPAFKRVWTRIIPQPIERSMYVLISGVLVIGLMWLWQPIDTVVWNVEMPAARALLWGLFAAGWLMVPAVSLMINHFDLFGTRQVWLYLRGREYQPLAFRVPMFYRYVRHPLYLAWALFFFATPTMTVGHLLFAGSLTVYMALAAIVEERDLVAYFGRQYEDYRQRVPMFVPRVRVPRARAPLPRAAQETDSFGS